jgi:hypothetical protein
MKVDGRALWKCGRIAASLFALLGWLDLVHVPPAHATFPGQHPQSLGSSDIWA